MIKKKGSALLMVILIIAGISGLLISMQYRCSLLLETVYEREKQLQLAYGTQALMLYAIHVAKHNWDYICQADTGNVSYTDIAWPITPTKLKKGMIAYVHKESGIHIRVQIENGREISCIINRVNGSMLGKATNVIIKDWHEK